MRKRKDVLIRFVVCFYILLGGCATTSNEVSPIATPTESFESFSCYEIEELTKEIISELKLRADIVNQQAASSETAQAIGWVLFWPAFFFSGQDKEEVHKLGVLKGKYKALEEAGLKKSCVEFEKRVENQKDIRGSWVYEWRGNWYSYKLKLDVGNNIDGALIGIIELDTDPVYACLSHIGIVNDPDNRNIYTFKHLEGTCPVRSGVFRMRVDIDKSELKTDNSIFKSFPGPVIPTFKKLSIRSF